MAANKKMISLAALALWPGDNNKETRFCVDCVNASQGEWDCYAPGCPDCEKRAREAMKDLHV